MDESSSRADVYAEYLRREGYLPESEGEGSVVFKREGRTYMLNADPSDPVYFQLVLPNLWRAEDETERREALEAANLATQSTKAVKVVVTAEGWTHALIEMFCESPEEVCKIIPRCFSAIDVATMKFVQELRGT